MNMVYIKRHAFILNLVLRNTYKLLFRANPGLEFVVAKTLAKWKKLGPNELYFSQGFSQKVVSKSCTVFLIWPISKE